MTQVSGGMDSTAQIVFLKNPAFWKLISFDLEKNTQGSGGKKLNLQNPEKQANNQPFLPQCSLCF